MRVDLSTSRRVREAEGSKQVVTPLSRLCCCLACWRLARWLVALLCRFALDVFTFMQQDYPAGRSGQHAELPRVAGTGLRILFLSLHHGWTCTRLCLASRVNFVMTPLRELQEEISISSKPLTDRSGQSFWRSLGRLSPQLVLRLVDRPCCLCLAPSCLCFFRSSASYSFAFFRLVWSSSVAAPPVVPLLFPGLFPS